MNRAPRTDLPYLRRRSRAAREPAPPAAATAAASDHIAGRARPPSSVVRPKADARRNLYPTRRTSTTTATLLSVRSPSAVLNRLQSGIGATTIDMVGDQGAGARLACLYQLSSGYSTVRWPGNVPRAHDPVEVPARRGVLTARMDMLRSRRLDRLVVIVALDGPPRHLSGVVAITTYGGARIEVPLALPVSPGILMLVSFSNLSGELVVRAERNMILGSARTAALAYGFEKISWADENTAVS